MAVNISTRELFASPVVTRVVRTIVSPQDLLQRFFGLTPDAANVQNVSGHDCSWDVFENTRQLANMRAPGTGPGTRKIQPASHVFARIPRMHEKVHLLDEQIFRMRQLGQNPNNVDVNGQSYVFKQQEIIAQRFRNTREFMLSRMLRGSFQVKQTGDDWIPCDSGGIFTVDFQVPAGNKSQLNITGGGDAIAASWATTSVDIPTHINTVKKYFAQTHGMQLKYAMCSSTTFHQRVAANTVMQAQAGTANFYWQEYNVNAKLGPNGEQGFTTIVHKALPWLQWILYDAMLEVDGTTTQVIPDDRVVFLPEPANNWVGGFNGSEIVRENRLAPGEERFGMQAWTEPTTQPAGFELLAVDNFLPAVFIPKAIAYASVVF